MHKPLYCEKDIIEKATDKRILKLLEESDWNTYIEVYYGKTKEEVLTKANEDQSKHTFELASLSFDKSAPFGIYLLVEQDVDGDDDYAIQEFPFIILKKDIEPTTIE